MFCRLASCIVALLSAPQEVQDWSLVLDPERELWRPYLADPRQSKTGVKAQFPIRNTEGGSAKLENTLGFFRPMALLTDPRQPGPEASLFLEAAVFSRFDQREEWDLDAADYRFGAPVVFREGDVALKAHLWHLTSHLGDEFISREGRERDSYHLDEFCTAISIDLSPTVRTYAELGIGVYTGPATGSGRAQAGVEWIASGEAGTLAPFAALDLQTRNEIGWGWNASVVTGLMLLQRSGGNGVRAFAEYYRGHDQQTQFKSQLEHYAAIGVAADF